MCWRRCRSLAKASCSRCSPSRTLLRPPLPQRVPRWQELVGTRFGSIPDVSVNRRLASMWYGWSIRPDGWQMPGAWDPIAGDYRARDGWIRLHTNAPHHRNAAVTALGGPPAEKDAVARAVAEWNADELEAAVVERGGCAATMRSLEAWKHHPQGRSVSAELLVEFQWHRRRGTRRRAARIPRTRHDVDACSRAAAARSTSAGSHARPCRACRNEVFFFFSRGLRCRRASHRSTELGRARRHPRSRASANAAHASICVMPPITRSFTNC